MQTCKQALSQPGRAGLSPLEYCDTSPPCVCTRRRFRPSRSLAPVLMLLRSPDDVSLSCVSPRHWAVAPSPASMALRKWNRNKSSSQRQMLRRLTCLLPSSSHCRQPHQKPTASMAACLGSKARTSHTSTDHTTHSACRCGPSGLSITSLHKRHGRTGKARQESSSGLRRCGLEGRVHRKLHSSRSCVILRTFLLLSLTRNASRPAPPTDVGLISTSHRTRLPESRLGSSLGRPQD